MKQTKIFLSSFDREHKHNIMRSRLFPLDYYGLRLFHMYIYQLKKSAYILVLNLSKLTLGPLSNVDILELRTLHKLG